MRLAAIVLSLTACGFHSPAVTDSAPGGTNDVSAGSDAPLAGDAAVAHTGVSPMMFSINWPANPASAPKVNTPWPTLAGSDIGSLRTWGSDVDWAGIETARCDPTQLDDSCWSWASLTAFLAHNNDVHFVAADYPDWSHPVGGAGSGVLPDDLTMPTGTDCVNIPQPFRTAALLPQDDCAFQEFVFALAMKTCDGCTEANGWHGTLQIRSFSPGNEVNSKQYLTPPCQKNKATPCANLARAATDLQRIVKYVDPTVTVGTPSFTQAAGYNDLKYYLEQSPSPGDVADVLVFHIYGTGDSANDTQAFAAGMPEVNWATRLASYAALTTGAQDHMVGKPMWVDEGGWGENYQTNGDSTASCANSDCGCLDAPAKPCMDADSIANETIVTKKATLTNAPAPGFLVRGYLQMLAAGVARFYWYAPGAGEWGSLGDYIKATATLQKTATAYAWSAMYQWLIGATMGTLSHTGTQWTYSITGKDPTRLTGCSPTALAAPGYTALIAWDTMQSSTIDCGIYHSYCRLFEVPLDNGGSHPCVGGLAPLDGNPILLEP